MKFKWSFLLVLFLTGIILINSPAWSKEKPEKFFIGDQIKLQSTVLNEERQIFIYTPFGYDRVQTKYPVLYVLDGGGHFHHVSGIVQFFTAQGLTPGLIVVAIPNTDRQRDFTPTKVLDIPSSGGADNFLKFLQAELFPYIEENYRTQPYRILAGHSLCGLFAIYTLLTHSDWFNAYIAISPWLLYDDNSLLKRAPGLLEKLPSANKFLYMTAGNEPNLLPILNRFTALLKDKAPDGLEWNYVEMENENHGSVVHLTVYNGLLELYRDWQLPRDLGQDAVAALNAHYQKLSEKFGYQVEPSEAFINRLGYMILAQNMFDQAIAVFKYNIEKYPNSANVYDSLGEALEGNNQLELALENYKIAVEKGKKLKDPNLEIYKTHIDRVQQKFAGVK